jgi:hypothetical protein
MPKFNNPRDFVDPNSKYSAGWGFSLPTPMLYDAFKAGDSRRDLTIFDVRSLSGGGSDYNESREHTGFYTKKYLVHSDNDADRNGSDPLNYDNNYRSIRYADVLLMAAEAEAKATGGDTNAAIDYLNQVRARAFGDNSQDYTASEGDLAEAILNERRLELAAEGHYFFDLVRTGKAKAAFDAYNAWAPAGADFQIQYENDKNEFLPIPLVELELANALDRWGQNQGY